MSHLQRHVHKLLDRFWPIHVHFRPGDFRKGARIGRNAHVKHRVHELHVLRGLLRERLRFSLKSFRERSRSFAVGNLDPIFVAAVVHVFVKQQWN